MISKKYIEFFKPQKNSLFLLFLGLLTVLLFSPFYLFFLGFFIFSIFVIALYKAKSLKEFYNNSFYFFLGFYLSNFYWISFSFLINKNYIYFFPIVFVLIPIFLALFSLLFLTILPYLKFKYKLSLLEFCFFFSFFYFLHELLRANIIPLVNLQGLPWNLIGYSFFNYKVIVQSASIFGVYGLTMIAIYVFTLPALLYQFKKLKHIFCSIFALVIILGALTYYGFNHLAKNQQNDNNFTISLIHTNMKAHHGFDQEVIKSNIDEVIANINVAKKSDLAILAEGMIPYATYENHNPIFEYILEHSNRKYENIILASPRAKLNEGNYKFYNSLFVISKNAKVKDYYDKLNLVPFGEYNPYFKMLPVLVASSGFTAGMKPYPLLSIGDKLKAVPLICYDGIFSGRFNQEGDFLINITNDIWFTRKVNNINISVAPWQHFDLIRMRAIEEGKPLVRVANYGVTAVTDSFGNVIDNISFNDEEMVKQVSLPSKLAERTIFNQYRNLPVLLFTLINFLMLIIYLKKRRL